MQSSHVELHRQRPPAAPMAGAQARQGHVIHMSKIFKWMVHDCFKLVYHVLPTLDVRFQCTEV